LYNNNYIKTQPTLFFTLTLWSLSETFVKRSLFSSSSGSCHDGDATWHELDRESEISTGWIKEVIYIWKEGRQTSDQDEGSYMLSHTYNWFLATLHLYHGKNRKKNWTNFFWQMSLLEIETLR